jgi:acetylglutamate kinase
VKIVVKIGGSALDDQAVLRKCAHAIVDLAGDGHQVAVIHGGGGELTRTMQRLGKKSEFINGLRVTDAETRDMALMVLAGMVNKKLVSAIGAAGKPAIGLCGGDGGTVRARKKQSSDGDLGYVGEICAVEPRWIEAIWSQGGIPVISSLAVGAMGEYYNVNADQMAAACAVGCRASALIFLTDVEGVRGADGMVIPWLDLSQIAVLVQTSVVQGGMLPKLEACRHALNKGVGRVRILPAAEADVLPQFYFAKLELGTEVRVAS